jgi:hypothetical protein
MFRIGEGRRTVKQPGWSNPESGGLIESRINSKDAHQFEENVSRRLTSRAAGKARLRCVSRTGDGSVPVELAHRTV